MELNPVTSRDYRQSATSICNRDVATVAHRIVKEEVAVIGIAVNLPHGLDSPLKIWDALRTGQDCVGSGEFPPGRAADISHVMPYFAGKVVDASKPYYCGNWFGEVDKFDPKFFGLTEQQAMFIEPEQRIALETAWKLFEDAGVAQKIRHSKTGVYVGHSVRFLANVGTHAHFP